MIAGLPMYDRSEIRSANDRLWGEIITHLNDRSIHPERVLRRDLTLSDLWTHPALVLSQTCGLPFRLGLCKEVTLVATPVHNLPCPAGYYFSVIVMRSGETDRDLQNRPPVLAYNEANSQSGWAAMSDWAARNAVRFKRGVCTGSHQASAKAVADGLAEIAAIDAVTWGMIQRWDAWASKLRVIAETPPTPALPFICAQGQDPAPVFQALETGINALTAADRQLLGLTGITRINESTYIDALTPPAPPAE